MIILAIDPGKNMGLCLYDTDKKAFSLESLTFKSSLEGFLFFQEEFEYYLEHNVDELDKVVVEFSPFGTLNAQLPHFFYIATIYSIITKSYGEGIFHFFKENKNSQYGVLASTWQSYISGILKIKPKEFDKTASVTFANSVLKSYDIKVKSDHEADALCINYWFINKYLNLA